MGGFYSQSFLSFIYTDRIIEIVDSLKRNELL